MKNFLYSNRFIDFTNEPLFFGSGKNSQRYDVIKYPIFDKLFEKMAGQDWVHDEIACTKDKVDFNILFKPMRHAYTRVLNKLIFLDSIQGRGLLQTIGPVITNPELEGCITEWQRFEISRHSRSYTHILRSVYDNPSEIFDQSFEIPELLSLADSVSQPYEDAFQAVHNYISDPGTLEQCKRKIIELLVEINILEGVRFYSGFACIWSMHYSQGLMERTSKILQLICRDENLHLGITQHLLTILRNNEHEGFANILREYNEYIIDKFTEAYNQECNWIEYLFKYGSWLGMSQELAKDYIQYLINERLKALGLKPLFSITKNPLPWVASYIAFDSNFVPLQESESLNYKMDILDSELTQAQRSNLLKML